jgi:hypothetical protein
MAGDCAATQHKPSAHIAICGVSYHLKDFSALGEDESRCQCSRHFVSVELQGDKAASATAATMPLNIRFTAVHLAP